MLSFVCVLKSGGDYIKEDAIILSRQVMRHMTIPHKFICLTDVPFHDEYVERRSLLYRWPGWWSLVEAFRITGPVIVTGLDTVILDDINRLGELVLTCKPNQFYMTRPQPKARRRGEKWCSGIMMWNGDWTSFFNGFEFSFADRFVKEQRYTSWKLENCHAEVSIIQDHFDGFYSFKNDCKNGIPENAKIVAFHGKPRPRECSNPVIKEILKDYTLPKHYLADVLRKYYEKKASNI